MVSPLLVISDYADGRTTDAIDLLTTLGARTQPTVVVLTARAAKGDWLPRIEDSLQDHGRLVAAENIELPDVHGHAVDVYRSTVDALTRSDAPSEPVGPPRPYQGIRWTTLDFVLLGWLAARGVPELPATHTGLYGEALKHEFKYWDAVHDKPGINRGLLRRAAACVSLVNPDEPDAESRMLAAGRRALCAGSFPPVVPIRPRLTIEARGSEAASTNLRTPLCEPKPTCAAGRPTRIA